jgi:hypothetical protein
MAKKIHVEDLAKGINALAALTPEELRRRAEAPRAGCAAVLVEGVNAIFMRCPGQCPRCADLVGLLRPGGPVWSRP